MISKDVLLQNLGSGKNRQAGYLSPSLPPRGEGPAGLRTGATSLKLTQLHPGPGEPAVPAGNDITEHGGQQLGVGDCSPLFCLDGVGAVGEASFGSKEEGDKKDGSPLSHHPHFIGQTLFFSYQIHHWGS